MALETIWGLGDVLCLVLLILPSGPSGGDNLGERSGREEGRGTT